MPSQTKLSDAAIAIHRVLDELGVDYGIFGGYAVATLGGPRESKDIDCAVNCTKEWLVQQLSRREGFNSMGNARPDLAQFIFGKHNILLEFFPMSMNNVHTQSVNVQGETAGTAVTKILDPVLLFKGKLQAAASRNKHSDSADLLWLEGKFNAAIKARKAELNQANIGNALARSPHLVHAFGRLGFDAAACRALAQQASQAGAPVPQMPRQGEVQSGLTYGM